MQKKYGILAKKVAISSLIVIISIGGFTNSLCEEEKVNPGQDKYCLLEVINYYPKADGTTKAPESVFGNTKANSDGLCPDPKITFKNQ